MGSSFSAVCNCTFKKTDFFFQSFTAASCHSARRACPKLQNPLLQKAKENLLCGKEEPVSWRMRSGEKGHFPETYPASKKVASVPEDEGYCQE